MADMAGEAAIGSMEAIGARITALREALGYRHQSEFSRRVGIATTTLNNYEQAKRRIDVDMAHRIRAKTGATLDWIYYGDESGLPRILADALAAGEKRKTRASTMPASGSKRA